MVEAECKKTGEKLLTEYNDRQFPEKCFEDFITYVKEAQNQLTGAMLNYYDEYNKSGPKGSKLFKEIEKQENKIKNETKKNPQIKIGKLTYKFYDLLMNADINLRLNGKVDMFEEFKKEEFVEDVIKAFD